MSSKKKTPIHLEDLTPDEKVKYEIAEELGLLDRVSRMNGNHLHPRKPVESEG